MPQRKCAFASAGGDFVSIEWTAGTPADHLAIFVVRFVLAPPLTILETAPSVVRDQPVQGLGTETSINSSYCPLLEKGRKFMSSVSAPCGNVTSLRRKRSCGLGRRNAGWLMSALFPSLKSSRLLTGEAGWPKGHRAQVQTDGPCWIKETNIQSGVTASLDTSARKDLISDATKSAKARTRGVCCMSRCMSR